jgi:Ca2+-binding EF-hand superfamily protein
MLHEYVNHRCTLDYVISHYWLADAAKSTKFSSKVSNADKRLINSLTQFEGGSFFRQTVINILVKMADDNAVAKMVKEFKKIDQDGSGTIDMDELRGFLKAKSV